MPAALTVIVEDAQARALIDRFVELGVETAPLTRESALLMEQEARNAFRSESDPWGAPWPPHAPSTVNKRVRAGNTSTQKLIDTGAMYASMSNESDPTSASVSMDGPAEVHQFGTMNAGRGHNVRIPPRPIFPIDDDREPPGNWWDAVSAPFVAAYDRAIA